MTNLSTYTPAEPTFKSALHTKLKSLADLPAGFAASEITGYAAAQARAAAEELAAAGEIVRYRVAPRRIRYFANLELATAYTPTTAAHQASPAAAGTRVRARWSVDEPGIITARTKITIAPRVATTVYRTNTYLQF